MNEISSTTESVRGNRKSRVGQVVSDVQSKTIVGIYIHICFLVERLVTKTALEKYTDLSSFEKQHEDFIAAVNRSFEVMLQHYHVKLPLSEIAYLFEYIENDVRKAGGEDEF